MELIIIVLVLLIVMAEDCAMSSIEASALGKGNMFFILGVLFYFLVCVLLKRSFQTKGMGVINTLWSALSVITVAAVGCFYFGEQLTRMEIVAVGLATIAAAIMANN